MDSSCNQVSASRSLRWLMAVAGMAMAVLLMAPTAVATRGLHADGDGYGGQLATLVPMVGQQRGGDSDVFKQQPTCGPRISGRETPLCRVLRPASLFFENRIYESGARWVVATVEGTSFDSAAREGVIRAISYFNGNNVQGVTIPLASPVRVQPVGGVPYGARTVRVRLYVPNSFRVPLPAPLDPQTISFETTTTQVQRYSSKAVPGAAVEATFEVLKELLQEDLNIEGLKFNGGTFELASYGVPFVPQPIEVWVNGA